MTKRIKSTESKYKGSISRYFLTYDLLQKMRNGKKQKLAKVKRINLPGTLLSHEVGNFTKKSGNKTFGLKLKYSKKRSSYTRQPFTLIREGKRIHVSKSKIPEVKFTYTKIVDLPKNAENVKLHRKDTLPLKYKSVLQKAA